MDSQIRNFAVTMKRRKFFQKFDKTAKLEQSSFRHPLRDYCCVQGARDCVRRNSRSEGIGERQEERGREGGNSNNSFAPHSTRHTNYLSDKDKQWSIRQRQKHASKITREMLAQLPRKRKLKRSLGCIVAMVTCHFQVANSFVRNDDGRPHDGQCTSHWRHAL